MQNIVVVDDTPITLEIYKRALLRLASVQVNTFTSALLALTWACEHDPDLIVVDYRMPEIDGLEFLERFRKTSHDPDIPIIVVTGTSDVEVRHRALELGATDFLQKPADPSEFMSRARNLLRLHERTKALRAHALTLEEHVRVTSADDGRRELEMLHVLGTLAGYHDNDGRYHGARIAEYAELIAARIGLDRSTQRLLALASPLHDIGKIAIPDRILFKPGKLSADEFSIVKTHCEVGYEILSSATSPLMQTAAEIARSHHECWDGSGYPQGIRGESIPFSARIVAVADVLRCVRLP